MDHENRHYPEQNRKENRWFIEQVVGKRAQRRHDRVDGKVNYEQQDLAVFRGRHVVGLQSIVADQMTKQEEE